MSMSSRSFCEAMTRPGTRMPPSWGTKKAPGAISLYIDNHNPLVIAVLSMKADSFEGNAEGLVGSADDIIESDDHIIEGVDRFFGYFLRQKGGEFKGESQVAVHEELARGCSSHQKRDVGGVFDLFEGRRKRDFPKGVVMGMAEAFVEVNAGGIKGDRRGGLLPFMERKRLSCQRDVRIIGACIGGIAIGF